MNKLPIFIHALFRAGSTYMFEVFRRSHNGYWCYLEPFHEVLSCLDSVPGNLLFFQDENVKHLRHPKLSQNYFHEYLAIRDGLTGLFRKEFSYDTFFIDQLNGIPKELIEYLSKLLELSHGQPVLQFCRSTGRVGVFNRLIPSINLHLWRNPIDQWWSYKTTDYFDAANQLIINADRLPLVLANVKNNCGIEDFHDPDVNLELVHAQQKFLAPEQSYYLFYALWLYSFLNCEKSADISINIDSLSHSDEYRQKILSALAKREVGGLKLDDCNIPHAEFTQSEIEFFKDIEDRIFNEFLQFGYNKEILENALEERHRHTPIASRSITSSIERSSIVREITMRYSKIISETQRQLCKVQISSIETEARAEDAELRSQQYKTRAQEAETRSQIAEKMANEAHTAALEAETRAKEAQAKVLEAKRGEKEIADTLAAIYNSRLWRITAPWRWMGSFAHRAIRRHKAILQCVLVFTKSKISTRPLLKALTFKLLLRFPRIEARLRLVGNSNITGCPHAPCRVEDDIVEVKNFSASARKIFLELKAAIEQHQKEQC